MKCDRDVGLDPASMQMIAVEENSEFRRCRNGKDYRVCNWLVPANDPSPLCQSCRITHVTPNLSKTENINRWRVLEQAKRRLLYSLIKLNLPINRDDTAKHPPLSFQFLEDRGSNPLVAEEYVRTGHATGVITINVSEADDVQREITRSLMNEAYRTPLGHCRHESGHYFYDRLVRHSEFKPGFTRIFGDPDSDYEQALAAYYASPPAADPANFISVYARSHPMEDWAECWAHYLHIYDTLETASTNGLLEDTPDPVDFEQWIGEWMTFSVTLNELNRSMGLVDAYPFSLTDRVIQKLEFISSVVNHQSCD
jgi:hypothetical protein